VSSSSLADRSDVEAPVEPPDASQRPKQVRSIFVGEPLHESLLKLSDHDNARLAQSSDARFCQVHFDGPSVTLRRRSDQQSRRLHPGGVARHRALGDQHALLKLSQADTT
jgi:hypothetical protein